MIGIYLGLALNLLLQLSARMATSETLRGGYAMLRSCWYVLSRIPAELILMQPFPISISLFTLFTFLSYADIFCAKLGTVQHDQIERNHNPNRG